ncbi:hypothetical protein [Streptomyces sp. NPDC000931]|uniref:hypothetical protein n=1 Tax=Streptomyces sp. NPDC000931 TaxID=3154372 RepID=UPI003325731F
MKLTLWRALLAPRTSLLAVFIRRRSSGTLSYDAAWRQARMYHHPDEMIHRFYGHRATPLTSHYREKRNSATDR